MTANRARLTGRYPHEWHRLARLSPWLQPTACEQVPVQVARRLECYGRRREPDV